MYKLQDVLADLLQNIPIKQIARKTKIARNTIKKYNKILESILQKQPELKNSIELLMDGFRDIRKHERYSENFGWLFNNKGKVETYASECNNYLITSRIFRTIFYGSYDIFFTLLLLLATPLINRYSCIVSFPIFLQRGT